MKENPQKMTAQKAVQDKTSPFSSLDWVYFYHKIIGFSSFYQIDLRNFRELHDSPF
jgi:hypothetical protein